MELVTRQENRNNEKIKVLSAEIVVHGTVEKPYYEIKYLDLSDWQYHISYSSYDLNNVFGWLGECFEIVKNENDVISEQVKELRTIANNLFTGYNMPISKAIEVLRKAASAIESLSTKLQVQNKTYNKNCNNCIGWDLIHDS